MPRTAQDGPGRPQPSSVAIDHERRYRDLQNAARSVLLEMARLEATPDVRTFFELGNPWLPIDPLRAAVERYYEARDALLPKP